MLRVLTLSTLFPDWTRPGFGGFVERQTLALAQHPDVELRVVAPVGLPPRGLGRGLARYRDLAKLHRREQWKDVRVYRPCFSVLPMIGGALNPTSLWWAATPILDAVRRNFPFDVIDAEFFYPDGPAAIRLGQRYGVPVSIKARGSDIHLWGKRLLPRRQIVKAGRAADGMLAVSAALRDDMIALGLPGERIGVHHTGVDQTLFKPLDRATAKAGFGVTGPLIVTAGNLIPLKGQALVIEAMRSLPDATLLIAGRGPDREALLAQIKDAGLAGRIRLLGSLPHEQLPRLLCAADVLALPSSSEGLANVWVEALACGTPLVITDVGGAREVVTGPAAGRLVDRIPAAIAAGIADILSHPVPQAVVASAAANFTWQRNSEALYAHLRALVDTHRA